MMDTIHLDLNLACIIGILPRERVTPQPLEIRLRLSLDVETTGTTGNLAESVDYAAVDAQVRFLAVIGKFRLIESLAIATARLLLLPPAPGEQRAQLQRVAVHIRKPTVMPHAIPAVELERDATWAAGATTLIDLIEVTAKRLDAAAPDGTQLVLGDGPSVLWVETRPWSPA